VRIILFIVVNATALSIAAWFFDGIRVTGSGFVDNHRYDEWITVAIVGAILGLVNRTVGSVAKLLALPAIILTLGLALLIVNALMLLLTSKIAGALDLGFSVHGFWTAVGGGFVISLTTMVLSALLPDPDDK
jgi:putative membrane protein